ncbi:MAG: SH3 domain-containing protein [Candidatus Omnitrophota bacterium]|jgi:N-acetylmuramoyl-L-alanine amidase
MRIILILLAALTLLSANPVDAQEQTFPCVGEVTSNAINIRCDSTTSGKAISMVDEREIINIVNEAFDWYKIRLPKNAPCFIKAKYVNIVEQGESETTAKTGGFGMLNADAVNLRLEPNESSCILGRINKDKVVNVIEKQGDWYKITPPDTACGWINKKFVKILVPVSDTAAPAETEKPLPGEKQAQLKSPSVRSEGAVKDGAITVMGIIEPYGKIIGRKGTHKITTESQKIYILKGDKKMLNSCSYRKAAIIGSSQDIPGQPYPVISVEKIEVLN